MALKEKDFIEVEFTGRLKDTKEIFDSNIAKDLEKAGLQKQETKPFTFSLNQGMFLQGIDEFLIGKEVGEYKIELPPEKAFGPRQNDLVQLVPMKVFQQQNANPITGSMFNFDGKIGKILSVSGGRVMVDFNNPIAGKVVIYDVKVLRKIEDLNEQIKSFINFLFRRDLAFEVKPDKIIIEVEKAMAQFAEMFKEKFKDLFGLGLEIKETAEEAKSAVEEVAGKEPLNEAEDISKKADIA
tara:strand:+ start:5048 stop:5767 length:720 start_codon:yes stop_codon:yes gene_type:complete